MCKIQLNCRDYSGTKPNQISGVWFSFRRQNPKSKNQNTQQPDFFWCWFFFQRTQASYWRTHRSWIIPSFTATRLSAKPPAITGELQWFLPQQHNTTTQYNITTQYNHTTHEDTFYCNKAVFVIVFRSIFISVFISVSVFVSVFVCVFVCYFLCVFESVFAPD